MYQVLLFYKYCNILEVQAIQLWQKSLCEQLGLVGRILIASEGINGTICGNYQACKKYRSAIKEYPQFKDINFKKSSSKFICFDHLQVKIKKEIVVLGEDTSLLNFKDTAPRLSPEDFHQALTLKYENNDNNIVILDTRNAYESRIGRFREAVCPAIKTSREFKNYFQNNKEIFKNKKILMYCTGGVRCERISVLCKQNTDASSIHHLENGIHAYAEKFPNGYFRGKNYVFDDRVSIEINSDILTHCDICQKPSDLYNNCRNAICNAHYIACDSCYIKTNACCSDECEKLILEEKTIKRPLLKSRAHLEIKN